MGVEWRALGPVVNQEGHPASSMSVVLPVYNNGTVPEVVNCAFVAEVSDYSAVSTSRVSAGNETLVVSPGQTVNCAFTVTREDYRNHTREFYDVQAGAWGDGLVLMEPAEKAYFLKIRVVASDRTGLPLYSEPRSKIICTPKISLRSRIICEDKRGDYIPPEAEMALLENITDAACAEVGKTGDTINDGKCNNNPSGVNFNNIEGCYDGMWRLESALT